jgi:hypothetical protein
MKNNPFQLFAILTTVGIGIYVSYRYVQWLVKDDIALTIGIMLAGTVIVAIISFVLYKMGYRGRGGN